MCILAVVGVAPMPMSHDGVVPASCPRPPGATSDRTLALRSAYIHPHNFVPFPGGTEMTTSTIDELQRKAARVAGFFYLLTFAIVVAVNFGINERLMVAGDPAQTARNILAHERLFRIGIASNLVYEAGLLVLLSALRDPQASRSHLGVAGRVLEA